MPRHGVHIVLSEHGRDTQVPSRHRVGQADATTKCSDCDGRRARSCRPTRRGGTRAAHSPFDVSYQRQGNIEPSEQSRWYDGLCGDSECGGLYLLLEVVLDGVRLVLPLGFEEGRFLAPVVVVRMGVILLDVPVQRGVGPSGRRCVVVATDV